eukprot:Opistho-2@88361
MGEGTDPLDTTEARSVATKAGMRGARTECRMTTATTEGVGGEEAAAAKGAFAVKGDFGRGVARGVAGDVRGDGVTTAPEVTQVEAQVTVAVVIVVMHREGSTQVHVTVVVAAETLVARGGDIVKVTHVDELVWDLCVSYILYPFVLICAFLINAQM